MALILTRREIWMQTHKREGHVKNRQRLELCCLKPRNTKDCWEPSGARKRQGSAPRPLDFRLLELWDTRLPKL